MKGLEIDLILGSCNGQSQVEQMIEYSERRDLGLDDLLALYRANEWSSAEKPELLQRALAA